MKANTQVRIAVALISCTSSTTATSSNARVIRAMPSSKDDNLEKRWPYGQVPIR